MNTLIGSNGCRNCKFWQAIKDGNQNGRPMGECRRYPPNAQMAMSAHGPVNVSTLPQTQPDFWCGEYQVQLTVETKENPFTSTQK